MLISKTARRIVEMDSGTACTPAVIHGLVSKLMNSVWKLAGPVDTEHGDRRQNGQMWLFMLMYYPVVKLCFGRAVNGAVPNQPKG